MHPTALQITASQRYQKKDQSEKGWIQAGGKVYFLITNRYHVFVL